MKKSTLRGIIAIVLVVILALGATIAWGIGSKWGEVKNVKDYFNGWGHNKLPDDNGDEYKNEISLLSLGVSPYVANGIPMTFEEDETSEYDIVTFSSSDTAICTMSATVYTVDDVAHPFIQRVTYSMGWAEENSNDVEKYVKMTVDGTMALFECLQPFSTQIIVTCMSNLNPSVSESRTIDYAKKVSGGGMFTDTEGLRTTKADDGLTIIHYPTSAPYDGVHNLKGFFISCLTFGSVGTLFDEVTSCSLTVAATEEFKTALNSAWENSGFLSSFGENSYGTYTKDLEFGEMINVPNQGYKLYIDTSSLPTFREVFDKTMCRSGSQWGPFVTIFESTALECDSEFYVEIYVTTKYGYSKTMRYYLDFCFDNSAIGSVDLSNNIVF